MPRLKSCLLLALLVATASGFAATVSGADDLFRGFADPPANARSFVRWWWNGNRINAAEITRQLDVLHAAGVGGVEINPIGLSGGSDSAGTRPITWLSREWNELVALASREARQRGMLTDLIVGSGWPFGGEFLKEDEQIERVIVNRIRYAGGTDLDEDEASLVQKALAAQTRPERVSGKNRLFFASLVPVQTEGLSDVIDLSDRLHTAKRLLVRIPAGEYELVYGVLQRGHRHVAFGAPGAAGPVMNHYDARVTREYLDRLDRIAADSGVPLHDMFRSLFCDSIELAGANWTPGLAEIFQKKYGYRIEPYYPFVFYDPYVGYAGTEPSGHLGDEIHRVRYDYNSLLVETFLDKFVRTFAEFCHEKGVESRYQSYGSPFLMGMLKGAMIPDIPEGNSWLRREFLGTEKWGWSPPHGYLLWNLYAASAAHLTGKAEISCEAMTNTTGVFAVSLEDVKRQDDMNFITGMNHAVLHGYNYSPVGAPFPGWVRFGTFFSERNPWWPWFSKWTIYNARLSHVFQQSQPVKDIAVLAPEGDLWSEHGLVRMPFHITPWYCSRLWESLSHAGSSCDYVNEEVIRQAAKRSGRLEFGPMSYQAIVLCQVRSLAPETAQALRDFVAEGGRLALVDGVPFRSLSHGDARRGDETVREIFAALRRDFPDRCLTVEPPATADVLLAWTDQLLRKLAVDRDVELASANPDVFQIRARHETADLFFFVNSRRTEPARIKARFPIGTKSAWLWSPETGTRERVPVPQGANANELEFELQGLESRLFVFAPDPLEGRPVPPQTAAPRPGNPGEGSRETIAGPWQASFHHVDGRTFTRSFDRLREFGTAADEDLRTFAGVVTYEATFSAGPGLRWLQLPEVHGGVTEVYVNGRQIGTNWYGPGRFAIDGAAGSGLNRVKLVHATLLANYCHSLKDNQTAQIWTKDYKYIPLGIDGDVVLVGQ
ncbi:MAG: hypothetical protein KBA71_07670 [Opitutaceae bacterium]|nr:hypothetical protein [Opitutaceae bacterium]